MTLLTVKDPFSGKSLAELNYSTPIETRSVLEQAVSAFSKWRFSKAWERSALLTRVAEKLESHAKEFANLISQEAGKPIQYARAEVTRAVGVMRWGSAEAQRFSGELLRLDASQSGRPGFGIHTRFPRGVILGITPFNFPLNLVAHKIVPAIASGCSIIIKPSPETPLTANKFAALFQEELPGELKGLVQVVLADDETSAKLTQTKEIAMVSFTGSARVGWMIKRQAPEKPAALELGGNAWVIVMEDTPKDLFPKIAKRIAGAAFGYAGQSCISVQNAAVSSNLWNEFQTILSEATEKTTYGNPSSERVISGPVIRKEAADRIRNELTKLPKDFKKIASKSAEDMAGDHENVVTPTLVTLPDLTGQTQLPSIVQEEVFGPVMNLARFTDIESMIKIINSSPYGLQTGVYTQNFCAIDKLYRELDVGGIIVNDVPTTRYDHQPYGGQKQSGEGREGVRYAMEEMTYSKFLALSSEISG